MLELDRQDTSGHPGNVERCRWDYIDYGGWSGSPVRTTAAVNCPTCGRLFCLADHVIDSAGVAHPSVVCPYACGFHVFLRLLGWVQP